MLRTIEIRRNLIEETKQGVLAHKGVFIVRKLRMSQDQKEDEIKGMLLSVIEEAKDTNAVVYAKAGLLLTGKALKVQVLYTLTNLQYWRGETARFVKARLKRLNK